MAPSSGASAPAPPTERDRADVRAMLGRPPRGESRIVARCPLGLPEVIEVPPILPDGTPFPTMYWLTCPLAVLRVGRLESTGIMREWEGELDLDPSNEAYRRRRDARLAQLGVAEGAHVPVGGVGGSHGGVKCLHARYAWWRAGGDDPAGARAAEHVGALDCTAPCITQDGIRIESPTESGRT